MVRLINNGNIEFVANLVYSAMHVQEGLTHIYEHENPNLNPCIYVMWHANQFAVYGIKDKANCSILISNSLDGELVARAVEKMGFKVVRGSAGRKGAVESSMQMLSRLKAGETVAIMVDGPHGPFHKVKNGAVKLAQLSGAPIIPVHWYSDQFTFVTLPSWDKMKSPVGDCRIINVYGDPIYLKEDASDEDIKNAKENIKSQLLELEKIAPDLYREAKEKKVWDKK